MGKTSIEWTDRSVNPIRARLGAAVGHYCEKVSPGCKHCYSSRFQPRVGMPQFQEQRRAGVEPFLDVHRLAEVLHRKKPAKFFWCDMTDLFGDWVPNEWIAACFGVMAATPQHTHQILTKRPERMRRWFFWASHVFGGPPGLPATVALPCDPFMVVEMEARKRLPSIAPLQLKLLNDWKRPRLWPLPNVWLGVSVEDRPRLARIDELRQVPAAIRFLSLEPLLEDLGTVDLGGIDWAIVGAESGAGARPMREDWARSLRDQCQAAGVPFFLKQFATTKGRKLHLPVLDGRQHVAWPEARS